MIKFSLKCAKDHRFDSWFSSNADYDRLQARGLVSCAVCGGDSVEKAIMAPRVTAKNNKNPLSAPASPAEQAVRELRAKIEKSADDVGDNFAVEARKMHEGEVPERSIIGQAKPEEAKALIEDGVPVMPLPWSNRRTN
ncbi:MAG: DUF1178 family protein [Rhodobacteraceae bacterium]|nr:DUF1178 family protein [Paracoccaceae bacterium]